MKDLKELLFKKQVETMAEVDRRIENRTGDDPCETDMLIGLYRGLFDIFVESGMEEEFYDWKRKNGYLKEVSEDARE